MEESRRYKIVAFEGIKGAGKTTIASQLTSWLNKSRPALYTRLSPEMGTLFTALVNTSTCGRQRYQDIIPPAFRYSCYVIEALVQFRYCRDLYSQYDYIIFDRWLDTYENYCHRPAEHREWYEELLARIPKPDLFFFLKVKPKVAYERLVRRGDWTARNWNQKQLLDDLNMQSHRYGDSMAVQATHCIDANEDIELVMRQVIDLVR